MTLQSAILRRDAHPVLGRYVDIDWLTIEAAKGRGQWHPFYDWLEAPDGYAASDAVLDTIEAALAAPIRGSVISRAKRLTADRSDFWSAVGELYLAAQFTSCGLTATLGNPDVGVESADGGSVGIEVNAIHATHDVTQLQELVAGGLGPSGTVIIWCADETMRFSNGTAQVIADRALALAASPGTVPLAEYPDALGPDEQGREVPIADVVHPELLRVFVQDGSPGYVATRSGPRTGLMDPWQGLSRRLGAKLSQLAGIDCGIVAIEAGFSHASAIIWAERAALGHGAPTLHTEPNIAGLVVYWLDLRQHKPWRAYFIPNVNGHCAGSSRVEAVLACLEAVTIPAPAP